MADLQKEWKIFKTALTAYKDYVANDEVQNSVWGAIGHIKDLLVIV